VDFDLDRFDGFLRRINPAVPVLTVTATSEIGLQPWLQWCRQGLRSDTESPARLDSVSLSI
jgi:Ni2+-binding GTPase involved in maturation of urease and hydrogenase